MTWVSGSSTTKRRASGSIKIFWRICRFLIVIFSCSLLIYLFIVKICYPLFHATQLTKIITVLESEGQRSTPSILLKVDDEKEFVFYLHYIKFRKENASVEFRFTEYLSVMSAVQRLKPNRIILHGDYEPTGRYWKELTGKNLIERRQRKLSMAAGKKDGKVQEVGWLENAADMVKLDVLLEYGGIVMDFDVFIIHGERIRAILGKKKAITCFVFDEAYNMGFIGGRKESRLIWSWRRSYKDIYIRDWNFQQARVSKFLSAVFRDEVYVVDKVCNNPQPTYPEEFFKNYGVWKWKNSIAIHTYERWVKDGFDAINGPDDLNGKLTTYKEMLIGIYKNQSLPEIESGFHDEIDPLTDALKQ